MSKIFAINLGSVRTKYVDRNVTIYEQRAPTDESIKLLNEMQHKVIENVFLSGRVENNIVNFQWTSIKNVSHSGIDIYLKIEINGNFFVKTFEINPYELTKQGFSMESQKIDIIEKCHEVVAGIIANILLERMERQILNG